MNNNNEPMIQENVAAAPLDIPDIPTAAPLKKTSYSTAEKVTAVISLPLAFLFNHFACRYSGGIWGGVFWMIFGVMAAIFVVMKKLPVTRGHKLLFAVAEIFCLTPFFCADLTINFLAACFSFILYCYIGVTISGADILGKHFVRDLFYSLARPFGHFEHCPRAIGSILKSGRFGKNALMIFLGLLIALPASIVVLLLLASSDVLFEGLLDNIFRAAPKFDSALVAELIFMVPIAFYLFGILSGASKQLNPANEGAPAYRFIPAAVSCTALSPLILFYFVFLILQLNYVGAAFGGELPEGVTISGFAREGFFQLCAVVVINLCAILLTQVLTRRDDSLEANGGMRSSRPTRIFILILSVETILLIATALTKMFIYIGEYGMTELRVYTSWFMILLAAAFVIIITAQLKEFHIWRVMFAVFTLMMGVLCFSDISGGIARYNLSAYRNEDISIDMSHFEEIGIPAADVVLELSAEFPVGAENYFEELEEELKQYPAPHYFSIQRVVAENALEEYRSAQGG